MYKTVSQLSTFTIRNIARPKQNVKNIITKKNGGKKWRHLVEST